MAKCAEFGDENCAQKRSGLFYLTFFVEPNFLKVDCIFNDSFYQCEISRKKPRLFMQKNAFLKNVF